jgi:hypothetical protein
VVMVGGGGGRGGGGGGEGTAPPPPPAEEKNDCCRKGPLLFLRFNTDSLSLARQALLSGRAIAAARWRLASPSTT